MVQGVCFSPFTIYHSLFTPLFAVLALARRERPPLVAFAELARRAAPGERALVRAESGATVARKNALDFGVGAWDDVDAYQLADAARGCGSGVGRGLDRAHVAAHEYRDVARADVLLADELNVRGLDHRVGGLDRAAEPLGLDHSECFERHRF